MRSLSKNNPLRVILAEAGMSDIAGRKPWGRIPAPEVFENIASCLPAG